MCNPLRSVVISPQTEQRAVRDRDAKREKGKSNVTETSQLILCLSFLGAVNISSSSSNSISMRLASASTWGE